MKRSATGARRPARRAVEQKAGRPVKGKNSTKILQRQIRALKARQAGLSARLRQRERILRAWRVAHETLVRCNREQVVSARRARELLRQQVSRRKQVERAHRRVLGLLVNIQESERRRIVRELHDEFGQELVALNLWLERMEADLPRRSNARLRVGKSISNVNTLLRTLHGLVWNLRPPALEKVGLVVALRQYLDEWTRLSSIPTHFYESGIGPRRLPVEIETTLYRIAQEALTNIAKHARARAVSVLVGTHRNSVSLVVEDNGRGFQVSETLNGEPRADGHLGLVGMRERASLAAGTVEIESVPGGGTTVMVRIPMPAIPPAVLETE